MRINDVIRGLLGIQENVNYSEDPDKKRDFTDYTDRDLKKRILSSYFPLFFINLILVILNPQVNCGLEDLIT